MTRTTIYTLAIAAVLLIVAFWFGTSVMENLGQRAVDSGVLDGLSR